MDDMTPPSQRMRTARWLCSAEATMEESDTYLMIRDLGEAKATRECILYFAEQSLGEPGESVKSQLMLIEDLERLKRMNRRVLRATSWQEILDTP